MLIISLEHTSHTNHIVHNLFHVCSNFTTFKLQTKKIQNTQFAVYISDTPVTLKQSQDHYIYNENVGPKRGHNHLTFERSCFHGLREKANGKVLFKRENMSIISREYVQK